MAVHRFQMASNKKTALMKVQKRAIAVLLSEEPMPKEEKARIRAESLIREDNTIEAFEIMQLSCELLAERMRLISSEKTCPADLVSTISTLIWASNRVDIPELMEIRKQFASKYGKKFEKEAMSNEGGVINERVFAKLSVQPPTAYLVQTYLERIAEEFEVEWEPTQKLEPGDVQVPMAAPMGYSIPVAVGSGYGGAFEDQSLTASVTSIDGVPGAHAMPGPAPAPIKKEQIYGPNNTEQEISVPPIYVPKQPNITNSSNGVDSNNNSDRKPSAPSIESTEEDNRKTKDDKGENDSEGGTGADSSNYDDLAARFNRLKK
eukprot:CAMPEP_0171321802 /NCGR_PEP_ID=MMETSP0816-20121228/114560_1 /TAXON_ID=420281 /ORGANISM="Proboscia inermis, Strain CCAP1064/1" /LENGTH=318 /DNA_ID=CAMNT_0011820133 /DNA_START=413 /DNA_END=1369 /DNA_ORIENTATION=-